MRLFHSSFRLSAAPVALTALSALSVLAVSAPAFAQVAITYSVAAVGPYTQGADTANLTGVTNATAMLSNGVVQTLNIGSIVFDVSQGPATGSQTFNSNRTITLNGFSSALTQNITIFVSNAFDQASVSGGNITTFNLGSGNFVDVTPLTASSPQRNSPGVTTTPIAASFLLRSTGSAAPEPGTVSLLGMGLVSGMGTLGIARRRKQVTAAKQAA